jgi:hypothetical protein
MSFWAGSKLHCGAVECRDIFSEVSSSTTKLSGDEKSGWEGHTRLYGLTSLFLLCLIYPFSFSLVLDRLAYGMDLQLDERYDNED